jgi:hypothetical protein
MVTSRWPQQDIKELMHPVHHAAKPSKQCKFHNAIKKFQMALLDVVFRAILQ